MGGGSNKAGTSPQPKQADAGQTRDFYRERITVDPNFDEATKAELLSELENLETPEGFQKYNQKLSDLANPETEIGKARLIRAERAKMRQDQPGLSAQTSFLASSTSQRGSFLGDR